MSAVVELVKDVVGGVGEAVGDIFEGAVEIVEDVGGAIDDYVIQPILDDPLTAIAVAAGAYYLGPMLAPTLGVPAGGAVATGAGAAAGSFASNVAQGEDFDQALKEAAVTGLTVGATTAASNALFGPDALGFDGDVAPEVGVDIDAFGNAIDAGAGTNSYVSGYQGPPAPDFDFSGMSSGANVQPPSYFPPDSRYELSLDDFAPGETLPGLDVTAPPVQPPSYFPPDSRYELSLDDFAPGETLPGVDAGPQAPQSYFDQAMDEIIKQNEPGFKASDFDLDAPLPTDLTGDIDFSRIFEQPIPSDSFRLGAPSGLGTVGSVGGSFLDALPSFDDLTSLDYYEGIGGKALNYAMENPLTVAGGALLLDAALSRPDIPQPPVRRPNESDEQFKKRLELYEYQRSQLPVSNIENYGYGAQQAFFTPSKFVPIPRVDEVEGAANGGLMSASPSYYRYGRPPTAMAMGGRMINSPLAQYGHGGAHGRSDDVPAVLSDGEYVIDAETVALLGNGSVDAGANALDQMREEIRKHKGKNLAQGKISSDAQSPLSYLKG
jgi:hypothetical protein